jgi:signal transduction histidine kinase
MFSELTSSPAPIAQERVEGLLAKVFSIAAAVLSIDLFRNALDQQQLLNPFWFWLFFSTLMAAQVGSIVGAFWLGHMQFWYRAITITTVLAMVTWPLQVEDAASLPLHFKPWIWWSVGFAALAAIGAFSRNISFGFLLGMPIIWLIIRTSDSGSNEPFVLALEDVLYSFFFSTSLALLVMFLRHRASQVDQEFHQLFRAQFERAYLDTVQSERIKINSIVHDQVVSTLDRAAEASTVKDFEAAAQLAQSAVARLRNESIRDPQAKEVIASIAFFESLKSAIERRYESVSVTINAKTEVQIPLETAIGLAEATFQALGNSLEHAPAASRREVSLSGSRAAVKLVVLDDGPGFRLSRVPRNRMGVRLSIFKRLETLGASARLQSAPGEGTTWVLEWVKP